jgi:hypothetical protein
MWFAGALNSVQKIMPDFSKFRPKRAVKILTGKLEDGHDAIIKAWAFSGLLAWASLDQVKPTKKPSEKGKRVIRTRNACRAQLITVVSMLQRSIDAGIATDSTEMLFSLLMQAGGFPATINGKSERALLLEFLDCKSELEYVHAIVKYLLRHNTFPDPRDRFTIEDAKDFVCQSHKINPHYDLSKISKIWEKHRFSAPYIFALFEEPSFRFKPIKTNKVLDWIERFVRSERRLARFLGQAAFAMDVLVSAGARNQRTSDFVNILRIAPKVSPFTDADQKLVPIPSREKPIK